MSKKFIPEKLYRKIINLVPMCYVDLVVKKKDTFLLIKRLENPAKNQWWFPGGRILFNEKLQEAVKRKLREEVNIKNFQKIQFLGIKEMSFKKGIYKKPICGIANVFLVEVEESDCGGIKLDKTSKDYRWFEGIQKNFHPYLKQFLKLANFK